MPTDDATVVAQSLHFEGRTAEAEALFREVLAGRPDDVDAIECLGVLVLEGGRSMEALGLFRRGLTIRPDAACLHAHLGEALRSLGRLDEAMGHLRRATELDPAFAQTWNSLGLIAYARGHHDYAESAYREAIRLRPDYTPPQINLANVYLARGRLADAAGELRHVLGREPSQPAALLNLARILVELRDPARLDEAEALARRAVEVLPNLSHAWKNLAHVLRVRGRHDEAMAFEERARTCVASPGIPGPAGRPAPRRSPPGPDDPASTPLAPLQRAEALHARGLLALNDGRSDDAEASFREAVRLDPSRADAWVKLARFQQQRGQFDECCASARSALAADPRLAEAHRMLAFVLRDRLPDEDLRAIEALLERPETPPDDRAHLRFGLAGVLDQRGRFAEAAAHLEAANALQGAWKAGRGITADPTRAAQFLDRMLATFTLEFLEARRGWGDPDPRPVFIVGLPRSGTTLTEQILASHPQVFGAGELQEVMNAFLSLPTLAGVPDVEPLDVLERLTPDSSRSAARPYLYRLDRMAPPTAARVVDKQPDNIDFLGLIALLWPGARVIVCHRDLRDVALSAWQMGFVINPWCNDWGRIAGRFADYLRTLEHWRRTRPVAWLDVSYERLVNDLEAEARRMIDYLGLEWDSACLDFHENRRAVRTPSLVQVRQPIHNRSVGRWRHYEASMQPLFRAFERLGIVPDPV